VRATLALALVVLTACGLPVDGSARPLREDAVPFNLLGTELPGPATPPPGDEQANMVTLCFVDDQEIIEITTRVPHGGSLLLVTRELAHPPDTPGEQTVTTILTDPLLIRGVTARAGIANIDLHNGFLTLDGQSQVLAFAQMVCTMTSRPGIGQVSFTLLGTPIDVVRPDGSLATGPVSRDDYASLLP
jgi:spore germination protein GerM